MLAISMVHKPLPDACGSALVPGCSAASRRAGGSRELMRAAALQKLPSREPRCQGLTSGQMFAEAGRLLPLPFPLRWGGRGPWNPGSESGAESRRFGGTPVGKMEPSRSRRWGCPLPSRHQQVEGGFSGEIGSGRLESVGSTEVPGRQAGRGSRRVTRPHGALLSVSDTGSC